MPYIVLDESLAQAAPVTTIGAPKTGLAQQKTLQAMRNELAQGLAGRDDVDAAWLNARINEGYTDLCTSLDLDMLRASIGLDLVVDQPMYLLPYVVYSTLGVAIMDDEYAVYEGRPLHKTDLSAYRRFPVLTDKPTHYFKHGQSMLVLWPTPEAVKSIAVDFRLRPQLLTEDTHQSILPTEWDEAVVLAARWKAHRSLRMWAQAKLAKDDYVDFVRSKNDPRAAEDENRIVGSSVPRDGRLLYRDGRLPKYYLRGEF